MVGSVVVGCAGAPCIEAAVEARIGRPFTAYHFHVPSSTLKINKCFVAYAHVFSYYSILYKKMLLTVFRSNIYTRLKMRLINYNNDFFNRVPALDANNDTRVIGNVRSRSSRTFALKNKLVFRSTVQGISRTSCTRQSYFCILSVENDLFKSW